ncbi:MAG: tRNA 2-thiouridine(34) synthase MnmA [Deltaproteobacteria bacterium]|nr:tRNA 2-thiouridine(34) synthase MnmA [Deltaproteobacteria bacterium]
MINYRDEKNTNPSTVAVALSGGCDSTLAAALLIEQGWDVTGVHFLLPAPPEKREARSLSVKRVGERLKIPVVLINLDIAFSREVVAPFVEAYLSGLTPNPCVLCNEIIKFETLFRYSEEHKISKISTGHYATVKVGSNGATQLWRGIDQRKEQSYFLHRLSVRHLERTLLPLGRMTKQQAKDLALKMELPNSSEPESQEICFLPANDYRLFLEKERGGEIARRGDVLTMEGTKVGEHDGTYRYTVGQRHGLGIASRRAYYVSEIDPRNRRIIVGEKEDLLCTRVEAEGFNWLDEAPRYHRMRLHAQIRYRHRAASGRLEVLSPEEVGFEFDEPQWAVTPGQALVCYEGDRVIGGGWIRRSRNAHGALRMKV